ncbi:biogenesis of lysosome-related organelles complex 1 subunit 2 isoform X3 [Momordica charantia]|uniref:Biogenesis of lysosome-related organelles complex 1 subunit 2 isoform X3 n=1 Tax=Momordica charantia TaxID=3673 RepID=A0A6J1DP01_MOMCH|nr:biogenesis of lysosome-related organelles complex 1 subunit 2 isoform X3 [Momordica charantia]
MAGKEEQLPNRDELAVSLNEFFTSVSQMIKSDLLGSSNQLALLEKMNLRVAEEYKGFGDVASGMRVFVEQLKSKSGGFDAYISQIENIEHQGESRPDCAFTMEQISKDKARCLSDRAQVWITQ